MKEIIKKSIWEDGWFWLGVFLILMAITKGAKGEYFQALPQASDKDVMGGFVMDIVEIIIGPFLIFMGIRGVKKKNAQK